MAHSADAKRMLDDRGYTGPLIRGQPPYALIETAVRQRITESYYWKEQCFGLNAATLCDKAAALTYIGGTYNDGRKPTPFLCLAFKLLQLLPEREIVDEYLGRGGDEWKYMRALAAFYIRLTAESSEEVYERLEEYLADARKLRRRNNSGWALTWVDQFVDDLLSKDRVCATSLWKLVPRGTLEDEGKLEERVSGVQHLLDESEEEEDHTEDERIGENQTGREDRQDGHLNGDSPSGMEDSSEGER